jgi:hypothetical protein
MSPWKQISVCVSAFILSVTLRSSPVEAQTTQEGLVNVNIEDVTIQIPVGVAANICDVDINVLVSDMQQGPTSCQAGTISLANDEGGGGRPARQEGLVNVNLQDVSAQVPIAVAANVCNVAVNILVQELQQGLVDCQAFGRNAAVSR